MAEDLQKSNINGLSKTAKSGASKKLIIKNLKGEFHLIITLSMNLCVSVV